jgi:hypothetical protein
MSNFPRFLGFWEFPNHKFRFPISYQISLDFGNIPRSGTTARNDETVVSAAAAAVKKTKKKKKDGRRKKVEQSPSFVRQGMQVRVAAKHA